MEISIQNTDIRKVEADSIICPTHVTGYMGYGVAKALAYEGGKEIENEAISKAPIIIGEPVVTGAGKLPFKSIIHASTIDDVNVKIEPGLISKSLIGALYIADDLGYQTLAVPGMGTGIGGLDVKTAAKAMFAAINSFKPINIKKIILADLSKEMTQAWEESK